MTDPVTGPGAEPSSQPPSEQRSSVQPPPGQPSPGQSPEPGVGRSLTTAAASVTVRLGRHLEHPVADVWSACTEPARLSHWFGEVGGLGGGPGVGESRWLWSPESADGGRVTVLHCGPPRRLVVSWSYAEEPASRVELRLASDAAGAGTELALEHTGPPGFEGAEHGAGWETFLTALDAHLATGAGDPADLRWGLLETSLQEVWLALAPPPGPSLPPDPTP